jgi:hypothetical protein
MIENNKKTVSRRKLLGDMGKLAYVAPTLTLFSVVTNNAHAQIGSPPCPPNEPNCNDGNSPKQKPRTESRKKKPGEG